MVRHTHITEKLAYVAENVETEMTKQATLFDVGKNYEFGKGQVITVNSERFWCPEVLFKQSLIGKESQGLHKFTCDSVGRDLYANTVLSGDLLSIFFSNTCTSYCL